MGAAQATGQWRDFTFTSQDGLRLHARHYKAPPSDRKPVLCLAGLTRNGRDFHNLALALSTGAEARTVYALDTRGRGLSQFDHNWKNYAVPIEMQDALDLIALAGLHGATVIGTSRGGLVAMVLAAAVPNAIGAAVLNDIGPVIERDGLLRISTYVGKTPVPATWAEAAKVVARIDGRDFPNVTEAQWEEIAHERFNTQSGKPAPGYDPLVARSISVSDGPPPALWPQFGALSHVPVLVVRGEKSDLLSAKTVTEMQARHPNCTSILVRDEGHAPLLKDGPTQRAIARFVAAADRGENVASRSFADAA